ncbi:MAG: D-glutamate deacylase, partial [Actinobacteria bacterium]|nr:D-glutamate deacylase [Actinomycetota bacterium]
MTTHACDLVLRGGRVLDPETGRDEVADVAVLDGTVVAVVAAGDCSEVHLVAHEEVDVSGAVVAPGWIDLHSHAQSVAGSRLQAHDGVTTALDLEAGTVEVERWYADVAAAGRAIGYGTSASWQISRMIHVGGIEVGGPEQALAFFGDQRWQAEARPEQTAALLARVEAELAQGALGVGMLQGYGPRIDPEEYLAVSRVAASAGVATFTHARDLVEQLPGVPVDGAEEIVRAAGETGVRAHYCHVNSSSSRLVDRVHRLIEASAAPVTTEAYPYGAGATPISADFLSPDRLARRGLTPSSLVYAPTGRRVADVAELLRLRAQDPGGIAIVHLLDEEVAADREVLDRCLTFPGTVVASDAMPLAWAAERSDPYA